VEYVINFPNCCYEGRGIKGVGCGHKPRGI
jgi:hypothetical protein